jgi:hypothetical protein
LNTYFESERRRYEEIYDKLKNVIKNEYDYRIRTLGRRRAEAQKLLAAKKIRPNMKKSLRANLGKIKAQLVSTPGSPVSLRPNPNYDEDKKATLHTNWPGGSEVRKAQKRFNATRKRTPDKTPE